MGQNKGKNGEWEAEWLFNQLIMILSAVLNFNIKYAYKEDDSLMSCRRVFKSMLIVLFITYFQKLAFQNQYAIFYTIPESIKNFSFHIFCHSRKSKYPCNNGNSRFCSNSDRFPYNLLNCYLHFLRGDKFYFSGTIGQHCPIP